MKNAILVFVPFEDHLEGNLKDSLVLAETAHKVRYVAKYNDVPEEHKVIGALVLEGKLAKSLRA